MTQEREFSMQVEGLATDVIDLLMSENGYTLLDAMDILYKSRTFRLVERPETGLFYQSPMYVYDCLTEELKRGKDSEP